jgi:hypothetical protein
MSAHVSRIAVLSIVVNILVLVAPPTARAQQVRTFVSGLGNDAEPCSRTRPCATFAGALAKTAAGGEIDCLDSGAFGRVTIGRSVTILCDGVVAEVPAILISAAASDVVTLSGLDIEGRNAEFFGVDIVQAGVVRIVGAKIRGYRNAGIRVAPFVADSLVELETRHTMIMDNRGTSILVVPSSNAKALITLDRTRVTHNDGNGVFFDAVTTTGNMKGVIGDSVIADNLGSGLVVRSLGASNEALVDRSSIYKNGTGLAAIGAGAVIRFSQTNVFANTLGVSQTNSGFALSFTSNAVAGNATNGVFGTTAPK